MFEIEVWVLFFLLNVFYIELFMEGIVWDVPVSWGNDAKINKLEYLDSTNLRGFAHPQIWIPQFQLVLGGICTLLSFDLNIGRSWWSWLLNILRLAFKDGHQVNLLSNTIPTTFT